MIIAATISAQTAVRLSAKWWSCSIQFKWYRKRSIWGWYKHKNNCL